MKHPQPLGTLVEQLMKPIVQDHGAMTYVLLTEWPRIIGQDLAGRAQPQRLMWSGKKDETPLPATLLVHVSDGGTALEIQQSSVSILQRINALYGWKAVGALKIKQVLTLNLPQPKAKPVEIPPDVQARVQAMVPEGIEPELRESLLKLGNSIFNLEKATNTGQK